jgi:hypothetical protein
MKPPKKAETKVRRLLKAVDEAIQDPAIRRRLTFRAPNLIKVPGITDLADYIEQTLWVRLARTRAAVAIHQPKDGEITADQMVLPKGEREWKKLISVTMPEEQLGNYLRHTFVPAEKP